MFKKKNNKKIINNFYNTNVSKNETVLNENEHRKKVENHLTNTNNYKSVNLIFEFLFADPKPYQNVNCSTK